MYEVQVIFPAPHAAGEKTTTRVLSPTVVARQHDRITWTFFNCDTRIQYAEIEFADTTHHFFPQAQTRHKFGKHVEGSGDIYGDVPDLEVNRPVLSKYTVRGWDSPAKAHLYSDVDPEILINEP